MANEFRLWTPVSNALEAYKRRMLRDPEATYEHIWRLIHIHEALVVTLGAALSSHLLAKWSGDTPSLLKLNRLRALITGLPETEDKGGPQEPPNEFCFAGSIKAYIDLLQVFGKLDMLPSSGFCNELSTYLRAEEPNSSLAFLEAWKRIAPVPPQFLGNLPRVMRFDAINSLRNKLAHVPLPERILFDLHRGLRAEVLGSLSPKYDPSQDDGSDFRQTQWHPPLRGQVLMRDFYVTGSDLGCELAALGQKDDRVRIRTSLQEGQGEPEIWPAEPFFLVDGECKVSLLFRIPELDLLSDTFPAEYHRFAAEFEPVHKARIKATVVKPWIPEPAFKEPANMEGFLTSGSQGGDFNEPVDVQVEPEHSYEIQGGESPADLRSLAEEAFRNRKYPAAVEAFDALAQTGDVASYNDVAKSKHGASLWRSALSEDGNSRECKIEKIEKALKCLKAASHHVDPRYKARANYEMSKAYYHLWRITGEEKHRQQAINSAREAERTDYEVAYISWLERLEDES